MSDDFRNLSGERREAAQLLRAKSGYEIITTSEMGNIHSQSWISKWGLADYLISAENGSTGNYSTWVFRVPRALAPLVRTLLNQSEPT